MRREKLTPLPNPTIPCQPELRRPTTWSVRAKFVWRDIWLDIFVDRWTRRARWAYETPPYYAGGSVRVEEQKTYLCVLPCVPIIFIRSRRTEVPHYSQ